MRKLAILYLGLFALPVAVTGCDGTENPTSPDGTLSAEVTSATALADGPKMIPYRARSSFSPASAELTVCTPAEAGVALPAVSAAIGNHTHLGRTTSVITTDYCSVTEEGILGGGLAIHTSARGDGFSALWDAMIYAPSTMEFVPNGKPYPIVVLEGTGRFEGVSGHVSGDGTIDFETGIGTFTLEGWISSVGSLK